MYLSPQQALRLRTGEGHVALPMGGVLVGVPQRCLGVGGLAA